MEQRDGIVDLGAEIGMKKHGRGSDRLRSGSKPNSIGATHNHAIGRMTHSQGSNSVAQAPVVDGLARTAIPGQFRFCRTKILRSSRGWRASTLAPISPEQQSSGHAVITTTTSPSGFNLITYKRKPTAAPISLWTVHSDSVTPLAPKLALRHGPRQSISVNRAGKQVTLRRVPNQTASITASDIDDDKPKRDGRASLLAFIAALDWFGIAARHLSPADHRAPLAIPVKPGEPR
jgi:hypothetical protein